MFQLESERMLPLARATSEPELSGAAGRNVFRRTKSVRLRGQHSGSGHGQSHYLTLSEFTKSPSYDLAVALQNAVDIMPSERQLFELNHNQQREPVAEPDPVDRALFHFKEDAEVAASTRASLAASPVTTFTLRPSAAASASTSASAASPTSSRSSSRSTEVELVMTGASTPPIAWPAQVVHARTPAHIAPPAHARPVPAMRPADVEALSPLQRLKEEVARLRSHVEST